MLLVLFLPHLHDMFIIHHAGKIGSICGTFNIGGGALTCREGGCGTIVSEGSGFNIGGFDSQATMINCSETCTCKQEDGYDCKVATGSDGDGDGDGTSISSKL